MKAWHFVNRDRRLRDGNTVAPGYVYSVKGPVYICHWGLHASKNILDALKYAPGPIVCRVEVSGKIQEYTDKLVACKREVLWMVDAEAVLHDFACLVAEEALLAEREAGREPDPATFAAIDTKRLWLAGQASDDELSAARDAAERAAERAARNAAERVACAAERVVCAAESAACAAERVVCAARGAAWGAAWAAERATEGAVRNAQARRLSKMVHAIRPRETTK